MYPSDPDAQRAHVLLHALELLGVCIVPDLRGQPRCHAVVVLAQLQAVVLSRLDQVLAALVQQSAVGGVGNGLGHDGGVHDQLLCAGLLGDAATPGRLDAGSQQRLLPFFSNGLSPAHRAGRIDGQLGLQSSLATQELPVRGLHQMLTIASSEALVCCRYGSPATRRGDKAGWPEVNEAAKVRLIAAQSISPARLTSGCFMLICSSSLARNNSPDCGCEGLRPTGFPGGICKKPCWRKHDLQILHLPMSRTTCQVTGLRFVQRGLSRVLALTVCERCTQEC